MRQERFTVHGGNRQRNVILLIMITVLTLYIAVPIYGVIQDAAEGETVFVIEGSGAGEGNSLLDKIFDLLFESKKIEVPASYIVDLRGTVLYSDKTPYSYGIVELRSTPRYVRTDKDGNFIFKGVEAGKHTINVLDDSGKILAKCNVDISTDGKTSELVNTSFSEDTYKINVSVNVEVLEIRLTLETDEDGNVQGISDLEVIKADVEPSGQPIDSESGNQTELDESEQQGDENKGEPEPGKVPEQPDSGGKGQSGGGGGGTGGDPNPTPFEFEVYDSGDASSFGSDVAAQVNIFGKEKRIAPGMKGSYRFTVDNSRNKYRSVYTVDFIKSDTLPAGKKLPMVFRLKAGNSYVAGDANTWCNVKQLSQITAIKGKEKEIYTLEWYWPEGENDNQYAGLAGNPEYAYTLRIEVTAQQK